MGKEKLRRLERKQFVRRSKASDQLIDKKIKMEPKSKIDLE